MSIIGVIDAPVMKLAKHECFKNILSWVRSPSGVHLESELHRCVDPPAKRDVPSGMGFDYSALRHNKCPSAEIGKAGLT